MKSKDGRKKLILKFLELSDLLMRLVAASGPTILKTSRDTRNQLMSFQLKEEKVYAPSGRSTNLQTEKDGILSKLDLESEMDKANTPT